MRANRILNIITGLLALPTLPIGLVTTSVGGCLVAVTFGLLLIPITIIWQFFVWPLLGLSWAWDKVPLLRIPLAIVGIPLAAMGTTYVALMPSMGGDLGERLNKFLICETWPFSLDYFRSRIKGIEPEYDRVVRIKQVIRGRAGGPEPSELLSEGRVDSEDPRALGLGTVHLTQALRTESAIVGELRDYVGEPIGPNRKLTIQCFPLPGASNYLLLGPNFLLYEFALTEYDEVGPHIIKFKLDRSALRTTPALSGLWPPQVPVDSGGKPDAGATFFSLPTSDQLRKVLELERQKEFADDAIVGGLDKYFQRFVQDHDPSTSHPVALVLQTLPPGGYRALHPIQRRRVVEELLTATKTE
jgi:hypothetical protein